MSNQSVEKLYHNGINLLKHNDFQHAIKIFNEVTLRNPFSYFAMKSQLALASTNYHMHKYFEAVMHANNYIKSYSHQKHLSYAHYIIAIAYYQQMDTYNVDPSNALNAKNACATLITKFPGSKYTQHAKVLINLINDTLAAKQMNIGRLYLHLGNYIAAIRQFSDVVKHYPNTAYMPEALYRLIEAHHAMQIKSEAKIYWQVLHHKFPNSRWDKYGYRLIMQKKSR